MTKEPTVYIALESDAGQLVIDGPLSLLDRLVKSLAAQKTEAKPEPAPAPTDELEAPHAE